MINRYTNYNKKMLKVEQKNKIRKNVLKNGILVFCIISVYRKPQNVVNI